MNKFIEAKSKVIKEFNAYGSDIANEINGEDAILTAYNIGCLMNMLETEMKKIIDNLEEENNDK